MDEYTRLRKKLESYLDKPDVELSDQEICAYDLYKIVDAKLEELRKINYDQPIIKDINKGLQLRKIGSRFKKEKGVSSFICRNLNLWCDGKKSELSFQFFDPRDTNRWHKFLNICKEVNNDEIYFEGKLSDKNFVAKYYDQISEIFSLLEGFSQLYQGGVGNCGQNSEQVFSDGFLDVSFTYDTHGKTNISLNIKESDDPEHVYNREWFQRQKLSEYVKENSEMFLRKIPVNLNDLNYTTKTIVENYVNSMNAPLLVKKK